ncbi:transglutaminase family protein [Variovorax sp. HJSM1_2]|uniref:transglutaminase family protein n=1 Tax=Variovorax sp. HJSM1_2 TaxID=3366263 RepID=UPI003BD388C5
MELDITHETHYDYSPMVDTAEHMVHLRPLSNHHQQLVSHTLKVLPLPAQIHHSLDVFGNERAFISLQSPHESLTVVAQSKVLTRAPSAVKSDMSWEDVRERFRYRAGAEYNPAAEFAFASPYVPRHADFTAYARPSFAPGRPLLEATHDLMERIYTDFTYESNSTEVNTPAVEALALRKGVCQDFAHIMVACLRMLGLPARYVSGYMLTQPPPGQPRLIGSDASHAWASVYVPDAPEGLNWCDFDPTNNRQPGEDYVTLATGRDFSDISPMRGVIHGGASHSLNVAVTVMPVEETPAARSGPSQQQQQSQQPFQQQSQEQFPPQPQQSQQQFQ